MKQIKLVDYAKPVLLISPMSDVNFLSDMALKLTEELTAGIKSIDFSTADSKSIKRTISLCTKGINRLLAKHGSAQIVHKDATKAEQILNDALEQLAISLNEASNELRCRAYSEFAEQDDMLNHLENIHYLINLLDQWAEPNANQLAEQDNTALLADEELSQYL